MGQNSIGQLTAQMVIEAEQAMSTMKKVAALGQLSETSLNDLGEAFTNAGQRANDSARGFQRHNEKLSEGEAALRGFYREQRLQDRTIRESKDALLGLTFGIMAVTSGLGEGSAGAKQFQTALVGGIAAMQAGEFAAFGLGTAGKNLGGTLGGLAGSLSKNAGIIGSIIGLGVGLYMFFQKSNEEAKKAAEEGLKKYSDMLEKISGKMQDFTDSSAEARRAAVSRELQIVEARIAIINRLRAAQSKGEYFYASDEEFKNAGLVKGEAIDISKKAIDDLYARAKELSTELNSIPNVITAKSPVMTKEDQKEAEDERKKSLEERHRLQEEMNKSVVSEGDAIKEMAAFEKGVYEAAGETKDEYIAQLRILQQRIGPGEEYNALQAEINRVEKDYTEQLKRSTEEEQRRLDYKSETIQTQYKLEKISAEMAIEELEILRDSTKDTNQRLKFEQQIVDIKEAQIQKMGEEMDQAARIGNLLEQAFSRSGDDFLSKLNRALQVAVQIAKTMASANAKEGGANILDYLESAVSVLTIFASTGTTGTVPSPEPSSSQQLSLSMAGGQSSSDIMANGQVYYPIRTSQRVPKGFIESRLNGGDNSTLLGEIRALRAELAAKEMTVIIKNPISLGKGLETEMPKYQKYAKDRSI